jgi:hypothetical protein
MIPYWYGKPREIYNTPRFIKMSHATARLYDFLLWMSDRRSSRKFDVTDEEITNRTTIAKRTLAISRKDLEQRGLIVCDRLPRGYSYQLCDPETGLPYPGDPKAKIVPKKKPLPVRAEGVDLSDVDFPFGSNLCSAPDSTTPDGEREYAFDKSF